MRCLLRSMQKPETELGAALNALASAGLLFRQGVPPHAGYLFKHAGAGRGLWHVAARAASRASCCRLPGQAARQLPDQSTTLRVESSSTDDSRLRGARPARDITLFLGMEPMWPVADHVLAEHVLELGLIPCRLKSGSTTPFLYSLEAGSNLAAVQTSHGRRPSLIHCRLEARHHALQ